MARTMCELRIDGKKVLLAEARLDPRVEAGAEAGCRGRWPRHRAGQLAGEGVRVLGPGRLQDARGEEQVAQLFGRAQAGAAGEVVDAVVRDRHLHRGVGVLEPGLPLLAVGRQRGQRAQVPTGGAAGDGDVVGVAAVGLDVLLDPGDRTVTRGSRIRKG